MRAGSVDVTKNYTTSGIKEIGDYMYVLKIDLKGKAIIQRIKSDNTEIKFYKIPIHELDTRWANPDAQAYAWIHKV